MTVRTTELLSPVSRVAITSIANGFSQGRIVRSTVKRLSTSGVARSPLTLTVASGEVIPVTVMVSELITMSSEGKVTSNFKGAGVAVGANVGVGDGKGAWVGLKVGVCVGLGDGTAVAVGLGVCAGVGVVIVTGVGEASIVAVGARVAESSPQAISKTRMRPKMRPAGAILRNGANTAIEGLAADRDGLLSLEYRDMHIPPNTSSSSY